MATISSPGTGSGINVGSLVSQLISAEATPTRARLDARESEFGAKFSALGQLKSALSSFQANVDKLKNTTGFDAHSVTVADETLLSASADSRAVAGSFTIEVDALAEAQKLSSAGFAGSSATVGTGTLAISSAAGAFSVFVGVGNDSLASIRDAINSAEGNPGVVANLVTVDAAGGGTETRLSLSAADTGTDNALTITVTDDDGNHTDTAGLSQLAYDPSGTQNLTETRAAANARVFIDSQLLTSQSNTVDTAIEGVSMDLLSADPGQTTTLTVKRDDSGIGSAVSGFVQSYNALRSTINELTVFDPVTRQGAILIGDASVRSLTSGLQRELGASMEHLGGTFSSLSELGVSTQVDGTLAFDESQLQSALASDREGVEAILTADDGVAERLSGFLGDFTKTGGSLSSRSDALLSRIADLSEQREALERRMSAREEALLAKFSAMDSIVSQLQTTSTFLSQQLSALGSLGGRSSG